jgi:hypothetical protein
MSSSDPISVDLSGIINLPAASTDTDGLVELASTVETQEGLDGTTAITPAAAAATYIPIDDFTAKGDILTATGPSQQRVLPVGSDGQVLIANSSTSTGLSWVSAPPPSIPCSCVVGKGSIITGIGPSIPSSLDVGANGYTLTACSTTPHGMFWAAPAAPAIPRSCINGKGAIVTGTSADTPVALSVGTDGYVLTACSTTSTGLSWVALPAPAAPAIPCACITGKGALVTGTAPDSPVAFPVGANGQVLTACSSSPSGLCWITSQTSGIPCSAITGKGSILTGSADATPVALPVGSNGQVLYANSACTTGLEWSNVGKTASAVANSGIIALTMDNLRVCFNSTGNRTWSFATVSGTCTAIAQTTCAQAAVVATQCKVSSLTSTAFTELGWNFTQGASCATYMICLGPLGNPNAIYCFVGMVGCNFATNFFNLTRLY